MCKISGASPVFWIATLSFLISFSQGTEASSSIQSLFEKARSLKNKGAYEEAIELYQEILKEEPENYEAIIEVAQVYGWKGEYDKSLEYYDKLLGRNRRDYDALLGKAQVLSWKGEYGKAEDLYARVIEKVPSYFDAHLGLVNVYLWSGKYNKALSFLEKLEREDPEDQRIIKKIFDVLYAKGDFKSARKYYQILVRLDKEYEASQEVIADLCLYTIDTGYLCENIDIMDDWKSSHLTFSYKPNREFTAVILASRLRRFNQADSIFSLGLYYDLTSSLNAYLSLTLASRPHFSPLQRCDIDLVLKTKAGTSFLGGLDYLIFDEGTVQVYTAGLEQYLTGKIYFSYQLFHSRDYDGATSQSHLAKLNFSEEKRYLHTFGYATGSEAFLVESRQEIMDVETKTFFIILKRWFNPRWGMNINASHHDRKDSYVKRSTGVGLFFKF